MEVYSEAELKMLLSRSTEEGELEAQEQEMLYKVFDFADKEVSAVMVPRPEVVALSIELPPEEALAAVIDSPYTRYPVYRDSLDEIVGMLHVRDLFSALVDRGIAGVQLEQLLRPGATSSRRRRISPRCWPSSAARTSTWRSWSTSTASSRGSSRSRTCSRRSSARSRTSSTCRTSRSSGSRTAACASTAPSRSTTSTSSSSVSLPIEDYHTIGGFVFGLLGRAPEPGDEVEHDGIRFTVLEVEGSRIERLEIELPPQEPGEERLEEAS